MLIGRSDDPHNPCRVVASKVALPFGSGSRNPSGPAAMCRNKQAGHTTATAPTQFFCLNPCIQGSVHTRPTVAAKRLVARARLRGEGKIARFAAYSSIVVGVWERLPRALKVRLLTAYFQRNQPSW